MSINFPLNREQALRFVGNSKSVWPWLRVNAIWPTCFFILGVGYLRYIEGSVSSTWALLAQGDLILYATLLLLAAWVQIREVDAVYRSVYKQSRRSVLLELVETMIPVVAFTYGLNKASMARADLASIPSIGLFTWKCHWWSGIGLMSLVLSLTLSVAAVCRTIRFLRRGGVP